MFTRSWTVGAWITLTEEAIRSSKVVVVRMKVGAKWRQLFPSKSKDYQYLLFPLTASRAAKPATAARKRRIDIFMIVKQAFGSRLSWFVFMEEVRAASCLPSPETVEKQDRR